MPRQFLLGKKLPKNGEILGYFEPTLIFIIFTQISIKTFCWMYFWVSKVVWCRYLIFSNWVLIYIFWHLWGNCFGYFFKKLHFYFLLVTLILDLLLFRLWGGFVEHLSWTYVAQQSVTKIYLWQLWIGSQLKLELSMSFCTTNWPLRWVCWTSKPALCHNRVWSDLKKMTYVNFVTPKTRA